MLDSCVLVQTHSLLCHSMHLQQHHHSISSVQVEKEYVVLVVELPHARPHQEAVVVVLMHASLALVAVPHANPPRQPTHLTPVRVRHWLRTVVLVA